MKFQVVLSGVAENDLDESFFWYEFQKTNLGVEFSNCINDCLTKVKDYPESTPIVYKNIRRAVTNKFPFSIYYIIDTSEQKIKIIAILHNSRSSEIIRERI